MRLIVSLLLSIAAGFVLGFFYFRGPAATSRGAARAHSVSTDSMEEGALPNSAVSTDAKAQRLIAAAIRKGDPLECQSDLYLAIESLSADDFQRLLTDVGALQAIAGKLHGMNLNTAKAFAHSLVERWLATDPGSVQIWAAPALQLLPVEGNLRGYLLEELSANRPEEMLAMAAFQPNAKDRAWMIERALRDLAMRDPAKARAWLAKCTDPGDRRVAEYAILAGAVRVDPARAVELAGENRDMGTSLLRIAAEQAAKMGTDELRRLASGPIQPWMQATAYEWMNPLNERDPEFAVGVALKAPFDRDGAMNLRNAFSALARRDPALAVAKVEGVEGPQLAAAVSSIGTAWAASDPEAALNWLAGRPTSERQNPESFNSGNHDAFADGVYNWANNNLGAARAWADALPAGETRELAQVQLARVLTNQGRAAEAAQVMNRLGASADPKGVATVASAWATTDLQAASDWALALPAGPMQNRAIATVVGVWAYNDPQGAENWLGQFPAGEARDRSIVAFLSRGASALSDAERSAEFEQWFDVIDDNWQRTRAAVGLFRTKWNIDPDAARTWLSSLPDIDPEMVRITLREYR